MALARPVSEGYVQPDAGGGTISDLHREEVKRAVVHIDTCSPAGKGTGFISDWDSRLTLFTCHHLISTESAAKKCKIYFNRMGAPGEVELCILGEDLFGAWFRTDDDATKALADDGKGNITYLLDYTVIEVRKDVIESKLREHGGCPTPLSLSSKEMERQIKKGDLAYIVHYPGEKFQRTENAWEIHNRIGPLLGHKVTTFPGSSGSPLLREYNGKWFVIGLHRTGLDVLVENEKKELVAGPTLINLATCISEITNALSGNPYNGQVPTMKDISHTFSPENACDGPHWLTQKPTLNVITAKVVPFIASNKWRYVGLELGMESFKLEAFSSPYQEDFRSYCYDMFKTWLQGAPGTGELERTWEVVITAVEKVKGTGTGYQDDVKKSLKGDIPLKEKPELKDLVATSTKIASMDAWYTVGLQLGISQYNLETIQTNKSTSHCFREMFSSWLNGEQHTGNKPRTWETLLQAVAAVFGGGKDSLTERIRDSLRVHFCNREVPKNGQ